MKAHHVFAVELPYVTTEYGKLSQICIAKSKLDTNKYLWFFPTSVIEDVVKLIGTPLEFNVEQLVPLIPYNPLLGLKVPSAADKKGKGYFKIIHKSPKVYIIETIINKKVTRKEVPTECIQTAWEVMKKYPKNFPIKTATVSANIVESLGIDRFTRESGSFDFAKFFGNRREYFRYFYMPVKILQSEGVINHYTDGRVERIAEKWELQTVFTEQEG